MYIHKVQHKLIDKQYFLRSSLYSQCADLSHIGGRGCAKESECYSDAATKSLYDGSPLSPNPAGMSISPLCCPANVFADDDAVSINYRDICNASSKQFTFNVHFIWCLLLCLGSYFLFF